MSEYVWVTMRESAVARFRSSPGAEVEQRVINVFRDHPRLVEEAIEHVAFRYDAGQIRSPWIILAKHCEEAVRPLENITVTDSKDRDVALGRAEAWMRTAGMHFDGEAEVDDELFGDRGQLRAWKRDEYVRERVFRLWREVRPIGEQVEREAIERAEHWKATTGKLWHAKRARRHAEAQASKPPESPPAAEGARDDDLVLEGSTP